MRRKRRRRAAQLVAVGAIALGLLGAGSRADPGPALFQDTAAGDRAEAEHRYRIVGKVRLLLFWVKADDVGGARVTWSGRDEDRAVGLLIGSDPRRAPRGVNEWGYIREHVAADSTTVFGIRTEADGNSPAEAEARRTQPGTDAALGVLCARVSPLQITSRTKTLWLARDTTYRDVERVLAAAEGIEQWNVRRADRPSDTAPGFLTALDRMMRSSADGARASDAKPALGRLAYVYKDGVYDLTQRRVERVRSLRTRTGVLQNLLSGEFAVRSRVTGSTTEFSITYGMDGTLAGIPVAATYQPNWWFKVELELDDQQDVPPDPAADGSVSRRITALCPPLE